MPTPPTPSRRDSWNARMFAVRTWVIDHAPLPLLTHAHEVGISVALGLVSLPFLLGGPPGPESVHSQVPHVIALSWAWVLLVSSVLTLWGLFGSRPRIEWAGQLFMGYGLTFYALALIWGAGWKGVLASSIFGVLGLVSWWRSFKITHAPLVQHRLVREARSAHELAHVTRQARARKEGRR